MTDAHVSAHVTLDEFMQMDRVEVISGEIVGVSAAGAVHVIISKNVCTSLDNYLMKRDLGIAFGDQMTFLMHSNLPYLRDSFVPDVSFIFHENTPATWDAMKPHPGVPDFAVEVVSPNDRPEDLKAKLQTYLDKGTREVWRIYPTIVPD